MSAGIFKVEIRTLNGKGLDINLKSYAIPKDKEIGLRNMVAKALVRGSVDIYAGFDRTAGSIEAIHLDAGLISNYIQQIKDAALSAGCTVSDDAALSAAMRLPGITGDQSQTIPEEEWPLIEKAFGEALSEVDDFRTREGAALAKDLRERVALILEIEDTVEGFEAERTAAVRERLAAKMEELKVQADPSRFEQEMIYYLEKLDITEEKVRLRQHCRHFLETLEAEEAPGRKIGFIIQEMGREINTTGSKANHTGIQKAVVRMKDELEKIREQSLNLL